MRSDCKVSPKWDMMMVLCCWECEGKGGYSLFTQVEQRRSGSLLAVSQQQQQQQQYSSSYNNDPVWRARRRVDQEIHYISCTLLPCQDITAVNPVRSNNFIPCANFPFPLDIASAPWVSQVKELETKSYSWQFTNFILCQSYHHYYDYYCTSKNKTCQGI